MHNYIYLSCANRNLILWGVTLFICFYDIIRL